MKITVLNGNPAPSNFDTRLLQLKTRLEAEGNTVTQINLRELKLRYCIGCFGCWVKTPGICTLNDDSRRMHTAVIGSDFTLWAAPLQMGFPSSLLKTALDKSIPLLHPYFVVDQGEAHHRPRYDRYPRLGLLIEAEPDTDVVDLQILSDIFSRIAVNMKSRLEFILQSDVPVSEITARILSEPKSFVPYNRSLSPIPGDRIEPPSHLTVFNGSPRGRKGNTPILLDRFSKGFASMPGKSYEVHHLNRLNELETQVQAFAEAECVWFGFPLYTDAMPGMVKNFIEALEPLVDRPKNPPIGFLVQSGFPEALHSRYVERYLHQLAARLGAPYLGTIVKGAGEGVRMRPEDANTALFTAMHGLGYGFAETGILDAALVAQVAGVERYSPLLAPVFEVFTRLPISSWYWDTQLKQNGVFEERFAKPYAQCEI